MKSIIIISFFICIAGFFSIASAQNKDNRSTISFSELSGNNIKYSLFAETGETESVFTIGGRNFPIKVGSIGLKALYQPSKNLDLYARAGIGYSPKQTVSAFNFTVSGSVIATSIGLGAASKYRINNGNFVIVPFFDFNLYNYSSDTFRGSRNDSLLKATVKGKSSFLRGGLELRYLTTGGYFFFGSGVNWWDVENRVSIVEGNLTITPRVWADNSDTFFQTGVLFETGNGDAIIGARMSDLTHEVNTQLVEFFAEVSVKFD